MFIEEERTVLHTAYISACFMFLLASYLAARIFIVRRPKSTLLVFFSLYD
jgi:hypothetical protein